MEVNIYIKKIFSEYLSYCKTNKRLTLKTIKAYSIELSQFNGYFRNTSEINISIDIIEKYIATINGVYKPKTVKRKIAYVKAFFHYLEYKNIITSNPFSKIIIKIQEPIILPKTIPLPFVEAILKATYNEISNGKTKKKRKRYP